MKRKVLKEGVVPQYAVLYLLGSSSLSSNDRYAPINRIFLSYEEYADGLLNFGQGSVPGLLSFAGKWQVPVSSISYVQFLYPKGSFDDVDNNK